MRAPAARAAWRSSASSLTGPVLFAHADLPGFSVFEEAAWWGIRAAERAMA
jgi:hypothetical protein